MFNKTTEEAFTESIRCPPNRGKIWAQQNPSDMMHLMSHSPLSYALFATLTVFSLALTEALLGDSLIVDMMHSQIGVV